MDEQTFLQDQTATVTSSRIVINGQTFATRNVGSVSMRTKEPSRLGSILLGVIAGGCAVGGAVGGALAFAIGAVIWWMANNAEYTLVMMAGGGEVAALKSKDHAVISKLHDAVAQAIAVR